MHGPKVILFDLDNTLYDFSATWTQATFPIIQDLLHGNGHSRDEAETLWPIFERINRVIFWHVDHGECPAAVGRQLRWELLGALVDVPIDFDAVYTRHLHAMMSCVPFPDAQLVIHTLSQHYQLGIVTNGPEDLITKRLEAIGLDHYFPPSARISGERAGALKPQPAIFHKALTALHSEAQDALYIGDSWDYDVIGASNAHIPCIWFNPQHRDCPDPRLIVQEIASLGDLLRSQWITVP